MVIQGGFLRDHWLPHREMGTTPFSGQNGPLDSNQRVFVYWSKVYEDALTHLPEEKRGDNFVENILMDPTRCDIFFAKLRRENRRDAEVMSGKRRIRPRGHVREIDSMALENMLASKQREKAGIK